MRKQKTLQELTIADDFMFGAVMTVDENSKGFLEHVLGFKIRKVTVRREKSLIYHPEFKGVRLDIEAEDEKNTHYNVEMQVRRKHAPGKRSRYYHSQIDMELLLKGLDYEDLPDSYVIFICDFDPFYKGKYCYSFDSICKEDKETELADGSHTIFLSTEGKNDEEVPEAMVKFLKYVKADLAGSMDDFGDDYVKRLQDAVQEVKASREMEARYMLLEEMLRDERREGKAEGKAEGRAEGRTEGVVNSIFVVLDGKGNIPENLKKSIAEETNYDTLTGYLRKASMAGSVEEFQQLIGQ